MTVKFIIFISYLLLLTVITGHSVHPWKLLIRPHQSPLSIMTDIINDVGIRLLDCYIKRPGNVAFSPTGLTFVLTSLYEGSSGQTNRQLTHVLNLPHDHEVIRVGMRDINRKLRNYLNADVFLGGLIFNRDFIKLRPEYEDILKFYGFNIADAMEGNNTINNSTSSTELISTLPNNMTIDAITENSQAETPLPISAEAINTEVDDNPTNMNLMTTKTSNSSVQIDSVNNNNTSNSTAITDDMMNTMSANEINSLEATTVESQLAEIITDITTPTVNLTTLAAEKLIIDENINNGTKSISLMKTNLTFDIEATVATSDNITDNFNLTRNNTSSTSNIREKRNLDHRRLLPIWTDDFKNWQDTSASYKKFQEYLDEQITELKFLAYDYDTTIVTTVTYITILPFAYFPFLQAIGLEFSLDDPRYNMIILKPTEGATIQTLTRNLSFNNLRCLRKSMKPTWVKATIPSFMLQGFITLTPYVQKLGIEDAFEPKAADLSLMSPDLGIYAKNIHQSIGVNIKNKIKGKKNNGVLSNISQKEDLFYSQEHTSGTSEPTQFIANRPFLFFIIDAETSISLIMGRIDDPLNSRIL